MARPDEVFPLRRLAELYRQRDGNLNQLISDLEGRIAAGVADAWAARVALAGIHRIDNRPQDAIRLYREAIDIRRGTAAGAPATGTNRGPDTRETLGALRALADTVMDAGDMSEARTLYEQLFAKYSDRSDKEAALRSLIRICLDTKDYPSAKHFHEQLVRLSQGSFFVRSELGREFMQRAQYDLAETEYREIVRASAGDNRALAPALRDLGQALVRQRKNTEAIETLRRALALAGQGAGVRREIHSIITEAYRAEARLPELISLLESNRSSDFDETSTLALLLEETGQVDKALETYRRALRINPRHIDTHVKVIHILQAQGDLEQAIHEYETLIRTVPRNTAFSFDLCEILIQCGDRAKALAILRRVEQQTHDEDQLGRLADFYERIDENDRALRLRQRLAQGGGRDPRYVIELGDRYFQQGDKKRAIDTWGRLRAILPNRAEALVSLGEVYVEHDMNTEAIELLREAVQIEPKNTRYVKALALALERGGASGSRGRNATGSLGAAVSTWEQVLGLASAAGDESQAREARMHMVTIWALTGQLQTKAVSLASAFRNEPPDIQAGRLLSEVQIRLNKRDDAEKTLSRLIVLRPGEVDLYLSLERVFVLQRKLDDAIATLQKLVSVDARRARQYYQRMAQYAADLYRDDDAVGYAAQAVALDPDDAEGHRKLGEMYRRRQDIDRATVEFRAAIAKNDRLFAVYFNLAEMLLARGETDEADFLYRRVMRVCSDEEMVAQAARLSIQVNLGRDSLGVVERELLPLSLGHPQKRVYRRLLVDLYGTMTYPLVQNVRYGSEATASAARAELAKIGARAIKPLLDALSDDSESQQRIAIDVLAFVQNRAAAPSLFAFATGQADQDLRVRAMLACGALRDPGLLPRFANLISPKETPSVVLGGPITVAATWGLARLESPRALPLLRGIATQGTPETRAIAMLGLGFAKDQQSARLLSEATTSPDSGNVAKAAASFALAEIGAKNYANVLINAASSEEPLPQQAALVALARLAPERASPLIAATLFNPDVSSRQAAIAAALVIGTGQFKRSSNLWEVPDLPINVRAILNSYLPRGYSPADYAKTLRSLEQPITTAAVNAVRTSPESARIVADALLSRGTSPGLAPFTDGIDGVDPKLRSDAEAVATRILEATEPAFVILARHPSSDTKIRAVRILARISSKESQSAITEALYDEDESVQRAVLSVLEESGAIAAVTALCRTLSDNETWSLRLRAARALGFLEPGRAPASALESLSKAARTDSFALVREAAIVALARVAPGAAKPVLTEAMVDDDEPAIRRKAKELLESR